VILFSFEVLLLFILIVLVTLYLCLFHGILESNLYKRGLGPVNNFSTCIMIDYCYILK
jgi:hypothetical protein